MLSIFAALAIEVTAQPVKNARPGAHEKDQEISYRFVPAQVRTSFHQKYPHVAATVWTRDGNEYTSAFYEGSGKVEAVFDASGTWMRTRQKISINKLPHAVNKTMAQQYDQWVVRNAYKLDVEQADPLYRVDLLKIHERKTVYVTSTGVLTSAAALREQSLAQR